MAPVTLYPGEANLEAMAQARRYCSFLKGLIRRAGRAGTDRSVLDFGAGTGMFADFYAEHGVRPVCVEPDPGLRSRLEARGYTVHADISRLDDAAFDYIYTLNVLEHIADDAAAVAELFRVLRPGGRLMIYVPAFACLYSSMDRRVGHLRRYTRASLQKLVASAGFSIERCRYADSLGFPASLLYRIIGRADGGINLPSLLFYDRLVFPLSRMLDGILHPVIGKNVYLIAAKPMPPAG